MEMRKSRSAKKAFGQAPHPSAHYFFFPFFLHLFDVAQDFYLKSWKTVAQLAAWCFASAEELWLQTWPNTSPSPHQNLSPTADGKQLLYISCWPGSDSPWATPLSAAGSWKPCLLPSTQRQDHTMLSMSFTELPRIQDSHATKRCLFSNIISSKMFGYCPNPRQLLGDVILPKKGKPCPWWTDLLSGDLCNSSQDFMIPSEHSGHFTVFVRNGSLSIPPPCPGNAESCSPPHKAPSATRLSSPWYVGACLFFKVFAHMLFFLTLNHSPWGWARPRDDWELPVLQWPRGSAQFLFCHTRQRADVSTQTLVSLTCTLFSFLVLFPLENTLRKTDQKQESRMFLCLRAGRGNWWFAARSKLLY